MISVTVIEAKSMERYPNVRVALGINWRGATEYKLTDSNGQAHFDVEPVGKGQVFVNGSKKYEGYLEAQIVVFI